MASRTRIDRLLVERGLFESRAKAQAAIAAGRVTADEILVAKPSDEIATDAILRAEPAHPYVSRGGVKLAFALDHFRFEPSERVCLDVGASTGGFSEVLLARGARRIYAIDVGRGQLHPGLRMRPQIVSLSDDIRNLDPGRLSERPDLVVVDVSFVSSHSCFRLRSRWRRGRSTFALIKPQDVAGKGALKKGIVAIPSCRPRSATRLPRSSDHSDGKSPE